MSNNQQFCQDLTNFMVLACISKELHTPTKTRTCEINGVLLYDACVEGKLDTGTLKYLLKPNHIK